MVFIQAVLPFSGEVCVPYTDSAEHNFLSVICTVAEFPVSLIGLNALQPVVYAFVPCYLSFGCHIWLDLCFVWYSNDRMTVILFPSVSTAASFP